MNLSQVGFYELDSLDCDGWLERVRNFFSNSSPDAPQAALPHYSLQEAYRMDNDLWTLFMSAARGDEQSLEALLTSLAIRITRFCHERLGSREDAEDAVQEVGLAIVRVVKRLESDTNAYIFAGERMLMAFIFRIARNQCNRILRGRRAHEQVDYIEELLETGLNSDISIDVISRERTEQVRQVLDLLPQESRQLLLLTYFEGLNSTEIGVILGVPPSTLRARLRAARALFQAEWNRFLNER